MNRKQLTILLVLVVVLGIAGIYVYNRQFDTGRDANPEIGKKLLGDFPVNDITGFQIKTGTNVVNLAKVDDLWRVSQRGNYPANYQSVSDLLLKLRDLKVVQAEQIGQSQLPRLWLTVTDDTNSATVVEFKDKNDKTVRTLFLGKKHMRKSNRPSPMGGMDDEGWPDGRYVKVGDAATVALVSDPLSNVEPKPEQWLNKDFIKIEKVRAIGVTFPTETNSWKLTRDTEAGEWKLADAKDGEQLDTSKASGVTSSLSSPSFIDVAVNVPPDQLGLDRPTLVNVETFDNIAYTLKVAQKTNDNYPLMVAVDAKLASERSPGKDEKPEDKAKLDKEFKEKQEKLREKVEQEESFEKWTYLVSSWTLDSVLKERNQLMAEKKPEPTTDAAGGTNQAPAINLGGDDDDAPPPIAPPLLPEQK